MIYRIFLVALCVVAFTVNADARQCHKAYLAHSDCNILWPCEGVAASPRGEMIARQVGFGVAQKVYKPRASRVQRTVSRVPTPRARPVVQATPEPRQRVATQIVAHPPGCPASLFCGCGAAVRIFGSPVRSLWLAANWFKFPRATPAAGMVAVRRHHVFVLEQHLGGDRWLAYDANSGGRKTRIHSRSIAGYVIVNPRGGAG